MEMKNKKFQSYRNKMLEFCLTKDPIIKTIVCIKLQREFDNTKGREKWRNVSLATISNCFENSSERFTVESQGALVFIRNPFWECSQFVSYGCTLDIPTRNSSNDDDDDDNSFVTEEITNSYKRFWNALAFTGTINHFS